MSSALFLVSAVPCHWAPLDPDEGSWIAKKFKLFKVFLNTLSLSVSFCQAVEGPKATVSQLMLHSRKVCVTRCGSKVLSSRIGDWEHLDPNPRAPSSIPLLGYRSSLRNSLRAGVHSQVQGGQTSQSTEPWGRGDCA